MSKFTLLPIGPLTIVSIEAIVGAIANLGDLTVAPAKGKRTKMGLTKEKI